MTKVYFACSIRGGGDTSLYQTIVDTIKQSGATVLSEMFINDAILHRGSQLPEKEIYQRDTAMIHSCDVVVAEVTNPSLGVGYEIAYAERLQKPILCLVHKRTSASISAMISGNPNTVVCQIDENNAKEVIETFLRKNALV